jgi:hypothetical protein
MSTGVDGRMMVASGPTAASTGIVISTRHSGQADARHLT